jgi:hypothetical protein
VDGFGKEKIFCCHRHPDDPPSSRDSVVAIPSSLSQPDDFVQEINENLKSWPPFIVIHNFFCQDPGNVERIINHDNGIKGKINNRALWWNGEQSFIFYRI